MSFEDQLINEINSLRTNPKEYGKKILKNTEYFKGKILRPPNHKLKIKTKEGVSAYKEAGDFLLNQPEVGPLTPSKGLEKIAKEVFKEVQKYGTDFEKIGDEKIIEKYGTFSGNFFRALDFGGDTPAQIVTNIIVSDGDKSRGQRESLLCKDVKNIGVATGKNEQFHYCSIIVTCTKFCSKDDKDNDDNKSTTKHSYKNNEDKDKSCQSSSENFDTHSTPEKKGSNKEISFSGENQFN